VNAELRRLLPLDEIAILKAYVEDAADSDELHAVNDALGVPENADVPRCAIAVAQILLHGIQESLPQWSDFKDDEVVSNRKWHKRHKDARLAFGPRLVCTIDWADSGPGFGWPEAYYVTYVPGLEKIIVTASRDGDDSWGCSDHAIGFAEGKWTR